MKYAAHSSKHRLNVIALATAALLGPWAAAPAAAAACTWLPASGNWGTPGNWSCGVVPDGANSDSAIIALGRVATINDLGPASAFRSVFTLTQAGTLTLDAFGLTLQSGGSSSNTGTINVGGAATAALQVFQNLNNTGGTVNIGAGSVLNQFSGSFSGGTVNNAGSFALFNSAAIGGSTLQGSGSYRQNDSSNSTLSGVTLASGTSFVAGNNATLFINGSFTNGGMLATSAAGGNGSALYLNGDASFTGGGSITLNDSSNATIRDDFGGRQLTLDAAQTLQGAGQVGAGTSVQLINAGTVSANVGGQTLTLNGAVVTNSGLMQASGGGQLAVGNLGVNNVGGTLRALAGSTVLLSSGATVLGGTLQTSGGGVLRQADSVNSRIGNGITLASGSLLQAGNNATLYISSANGDTLINNGEIRTSAAGGNSSVLYLDRGGVLNVSGTGSITLQDNNAGIRDDFGGRVLGLGSGQVLQGYGNVGQGTALSVVNAGVITANQNGRTLVLQMSNGLTNNNLLRAESGGTLEVVGGTGIANSGATLNARTGGTVALGSTVTVFGGTLTGSGSFVQRDSVGSRLSGTQIGTLNVTNVPDALTIASGTTFTAGNNANLFIDGSIVNDGSLVTAAAGGNSSNLYINTSGGVSVSGSGSITLQDSNAILRDDYGSRSFSNGANHTIQGWGNLGAGTSLVISNAGLITANQTGRTLVLQTSGNLRNTGVVRAENGGTLEITSGTIVNNSGATLQAQAASTVGLGSNATVVGGLLTGSGSFVQRDSVNSRLSGTQLGTLGGTNVIDPLTLDAGSTVTAGNNANLYFDGSIVNKGSIVTSAAGGNSSNLYVNTSGGVSFTGNGSITLQNANALLRDDYGSRSFSNGAAHTIQGYGQVGAGTTLGITNLGLITANVNATTLTLQTSQAVANAGTLRAENGGTLLVTNTQVNNSGFITAEGGATVVLGHGATIVGGTLSSVGSGRLRTADGASARLTDVGIAAASTLLAGVNGATYFNGTLTNNGNIQGTGAAGNTTNLYVNTADGAVFNGSGTLTLQNGNDVLRDDYGSRSFTNGANHTVQGYGQLGAGTTLAISNSGTVTANRAGSTLLVSTSGGSTTTATGVLRAQGGGTLAFGSGVHTVQAGGLVEALADSSVLVNGSASFSNLAGGTLSTGIWKANSVGGGAGLIDFQTNNTTITANAADIYLIGAASQISGRDAGGNLRTLDQTLSSNLGSLRVQQGRVFIASANAGSFINGSGALLELSDGGFVSTNLTLADSASRINSFGSSSVTTSNAISGNGQINVLGGTLTLSKGFNLSGGSVASIASGAALNLSAATSASTTDRLNDSGALALGTQNLLVTKDYLNNNFGVGNAFNARAGVTGSGLIVGVGASDTITGAVTFSAANTWVLDLGNVRGGTSRSASFQVANNGSGADIRGALQTTALTDARISGSGAVAGNFGPLAAGSSSASYTVTLNATSGGALTGQSLAVASNFSNVATQTINLAGFATALAAGSATPQTNPVALANFRVGGSQPTQSFAVLNSTTGSGAERLGIASVGSSGNFIATNNLGAGFVAPGASFAGAVSAAVNGGVAGVNSGSLTINYTTNGQLIDPSFVTQAANVQTIALQATGYLVASGSAAPTPVTLAAQRVNGTLSVPLVITNTTTGGLFSEDLNAAFSASTGSAIGSGSINGRLAGTSNTGSGSMTVALNTSSSGAKTGSVTIAFQTAGTVAGVSNSLGVAPAGTQTINVSGNVYAPAVAQLGTPAVNFGIVRVGDAVAPASVTVSNTATGALTDTLRATLSGGASPFNAGGTASGIVAGGTNSGGLTVGLNTATAGIYNGSAQVAYTSQNPEMADLALGSAAVTLAAQVNNLAATTLAKSSGAGTFSGSASSYTLNLGSVLLGASGGQASLTLTNSASGPADALNGSFNLSALQSGDPFSLTGFTSFASLAAGSSLNGLVVGFSGTTLGSFDRVIVLNRVSTNGSGPDLNLSPVQLHLQGSVVAVPEPGTWAMWLAGLGLMLRFVRRRLGTQAQRM